MTETDRKDIELIFKTCYRELCLLAYSYVACTDQAEDVVQDVFVKLLMKGKAANIANLKSYIWKSVKNSSLKHVARSKKMESIEQSNLVLVEEEETWDEERDLKLRKAMEKLPPKCKDVFELCVFDGHKYDSAADSLGISVNTVKTQMKKAFRILRHNLADIYFFLLFFGFNY